MGKSMGSKAVTESDAMSQNSVFLIMLGISPLSTSYLYLQLLLLFEHLSEDIAPLLIHTSRHLSPQWQPATTQVTESKHLVDTFPNTQDTILDNVLLASRNLPLQPPHLLEGGLVQRTLARQAEQMRDGLGEDGRETVDDAAGVEDHDGAELLSEAGEDAEGLVVDLRVQRDLNVVAHVAVGHFAADDLGVGGELFVGLDADDQVVGDPRVVVAVSQSVLLTGLGFKPLT